MRVKRGWVDQWQTEADEDLTLWSFVAAFAVLTLLLVVAFMYVMVLTPQ